MCLQVPHHNIVHLGSAFNYDLSLTSEYEVVKGNTKDSVTVLVKPEATEVSHVPLFWLRFGTMGRLERLAVMVSNFLHNNPILTIMSFWSWKRMFDGMLAVFLPFHSWLYSYSLHFAEFIWGMFTIDISVKLY